MSAFEGSPADLVAVGGKGSSSTSNYLVVASSSSLEVSSSYSGPSYSFVAPVDPSSSPPQLGVKRGDRLRLTGAGPNGGREFIIASVAATVLSVIETVLDPGTDTTEYEFSVLRRLS